MSNDLDEEDLPVTKTKKHYEDDDVNSEADYQEENEDNIQDSEVAPFDKEAVFNCGTGIIRRAYKL